MRRAVAVAVVAVALGLTWGLGDWEKRREHTQGIKYKGTVVLALHAVRHGQRFEVQPHTELYAGDSIEFTATTSQAGILCTETMTSSKSGSTARIGYR